MVVVFREGLEGGLEFRASCEEFAGQEFVAELAKAALDLAVLPGFALATLVGKPSPGG